MKKISLITAGLAALCIAGVADAKDKDRVTQNYDLTGFDRIEIAGVYDLDVRVGPDFSIELSGEREEMERVEASVENGVLYLEKSKRKKMGFGFKDRDETIDATITLPSLTALEISGVVDGRITGIDADEFSLDLSGVGDITLDGECGSLDADVSGVGDLDARALECASVEVDVSGVGDASVFASEEVDAEVSGMGDIDVYGSPEKVHKQGGMFADVTIH